jgi:transcriptional regulator with XRE-family HTH domain
MTLDQILDSLAKMPPRLDVAAAPSPEVIAFFVRWVRGLRQWKQQTLASFAEVSLSTIERVERAEKVSNEYLDRIAVALGYGAGYFTAPRLPLPPDEAVGKLEETWENLVPVHVRRLSTQNAIRQLGNCHGFLLHRPGVDEAFDDLLAEFAEWLDLASYLIGCPDWAGKTAGCRRELYKNILACVHRLERSGLNVLGGVMDAPQSEFPDWKVAVICVTPKQTDPGALKRREILVDRRCVEIPANWPAWCETELHF